MALWRPNEVTPYCHVEGQKNYPIIFGQLTQCDGSFLVGRSSEENFQWASLKGKHILAGRKGGMPAMTLQYVMEKNGVALDSDGTNFDTKVEFNNMIGAFEGDKSIDYCTMFEPAASDFVSAGKGHIVASVGEASGKVPYTAFAASKKWLSEKKDTATKFLKAVYKGYKFLMENDTLAVANSLSKSFVGTPITSIQASIASYKDINAWRSSPEMAEADFNLLQDIMENAGTLSARADFKLAVDNSIAKTVVAN